MRFVTFLFLLISVGFAFAGEHTIPQELSQGLQLYNDGRLIEAYAAFNDYQKTHSSDARAVFLTALSKWKMMWLSFYDKKDREELLRLLNRAEGLCESRPLNDHEAYFYYAAVLGIHAQLAATEGDWWDTAQIGKKMKRTSEKLVEEDSQYVEPYYLLGSFNYFADALPDHIKFIRALLFLPGGNREEGLGQLKLAYEKSELVSAEAGRTLAMIYTYFEREYRLGNEFCDEMLKVYPDSYDIGLYKGINLYFSGKFEESEKHLQEVRKGIFAYSKMNSKNGNGEVVQVYRPMEREIRYWIARSLIQQKRWDEAQEILMQLANPEIHQPYWLMRGVFLSLAVIDLAHGREEKAQYRIRRVMDWPDAKNSHEKAELLKKKRLGINRFDIDFPD